MNVVFGIMAELVVEGFAEVAAEPARRVDFAEGVASYVEHRPPPCRPLPPKGTSLEDRQP